MGASVDEGKIQAALEHLQAEMAFQGETIHALNDALGAQQREMLLIREQLAVLGTQLRKLREAAPDGPSTDPEPPPPHY
jgi:SlyX protein